MLIHTRAQVATVLFILLALVIAPFYVESLDTATRTTLMQEGGIVESLSALGYVLCVVLLAVRGGAHHLRRYWYIPVFLMLLCFRELDFDKRFTEMGMLKSKFLFTASVPWQQKLAGVALIGLLATLAFQFIRHHFKPYFRKMRGFDMPYWTISIALGLMVIAKSIDGLPRKMADFGVTVTAEIRWMASSFEEIFELGIPVLFIAGAWFYFQQQAQERAMPASLTVANSRAG